MAHITNKKQFVLSIILLALILIVINLISRSLFFRWDVTQDKVYSLSESSKQIIQKLDDRMTARVYYSADLPGEYVNSRRYLQDILEEYRAYSKGNFHFEFVNPDESEKNKQEAEGYRIPPIQLRVIENDKLEIKNVYMGLVLLYQDKREVLPVIQSTDGLEYDLTASVKKIIAKDLKKIGLITGAGKDASTKNVSQFLKQTYMVTNPSLNKPIPGDINLVLMNGVLDSLTLEELYNLDQFLIRGGKLFISQARQEAKVQEGIAGSIASNIYSFLEHYGLQINPDIIIDKHCSQIQIQQQQGIFRFTNAIDYPFIPVIRKFNEANPIVAGLDEVRVFFAHEISPAHEGIGFEPLLWTSNNSGSIPEGYLPVPGQGGNYSLRQGYNIYPVENEQIKKFNRQSAVVAVLRSGYADSYFKDSTDFSGREDFIPRSDNTQILLISDNRYFDDKRGGGSPENLTFILNAADVLSGDEELVAIRNRGIYIRPLKPEVLASETARKFWKWLNIILPSVLVIVLAIIMSARKKKKRRMLEENYG